MRLPGMPASPAGVAPPAFASAERRAPDAAGERPRPARADDGSVRFATLLRPGAAARSWQGRAGSLNDPLAGAAEQHGGLHRLQLLAPDGGDGHQALGAPAAPRRLGLPLPRASKRALGALLQRLRERLAHALLACGLFANGLLIGRGPRRDRRPTDGERLAGLVEREPTVRRSLRNLGEPQPGPRGTSGARLDSAVEARLRRGQLFGVAAARLLPGEPLRASARLGLPLRLLHRVVSRLPFSGVPLGKRGVLDALPRRRAGTVPGRRVFDGRAGGAHRPLLGVMIELTGDGGARGRGDQQHCTGDERPHAPAGRKPRCPSWASTSCPQAAAISRPLGMRTRHSCP